MSNSIHSNIDPWVGQTLRNYRRAKGWTQEELGDAISRCIESKAGRKEIGLSKSAISRIEKGLFIPPQSKLEIMIALLDIRNPQECQRLFAECGYTAPTAQSPATESTAASWLASSQAGESPDSPQQWLAQVSWFNQEKKYSQALETVAEAQLALGRLPESPERSLAEKLLNSKQQFAYAMLLENKPESIPNLKRSVSWAQEAENIWNQHKKDWGKQEDYIQLLGEALRSQISALFRLFYQEYIVNVDYQDLAKPQAAYQKILGNIQRFEKLFESRSHATSPDSLERYLYIQREKISLEVKWLEIQEEFALRSYLHQAWPGEFGPNMAQDAIPVKLFGLRQNKATKAKADKLFQQLYQSTEHQLYFEPARTLHPQWQDFYLELQQFLATHQELLHHSILPDALPKVPVVNTCLLYVVILARTGKFNRDEGELLLNTLYFMTNAHTLPIWHYISACFYACRYLHHRNWKDAEKVVMHWMHWSRSSLQHPERFDLPRFKGFLREPCLWVTFMELAEQRHNTKSELLAWLLPKFVGTMKEEEPVT